MPNRVVPFALLLAGVLHTLPAMADDAQTASLRRPVSLAVSANEKFVYAANRETGTVSVIDTGTLSVVNEVPIGRKLSRVFRLGAKHLLAADARAHELILLSADGQNIAVLQRIPVSPYPQHIAVTADGGRAFVSSLWSHRVTVLEIASNDSGPTSLRVTNTIDLPFAGGSQLLVENDAVLIVADHFRGRLALIDVAKGELKTTRKFFAHNIRGLAIDPRSKLLAVSHSMLNEYATTVQNDVHWGVLMSNDLRWLHLEHVLDPNREFYNKGHMHPLGEPGMGGSDPGELAFCDDGTVVVPMSGMNKVAFGKEGDFGLHRVDVGRRPTTVAVANQQKKAYVANTLDDSISVIDLVKKERLQDIPLGPTRDLTLAERGEVLFHSGRLAHDGWMTCHTCHPEGHATSDLNDNFSDKSFGAAKRVLSLLGAKDTAPYAWNGKMETLEEQIKSSIQHTMQGKRHGDEEIQAIAAYLVTLEAPPSVGQLRGDQDALAISRGEKLFASLSCIDCHTPPLYTSPKAYDVGIHDKEGNTHFNPPSLRGISQRGPFFHNAAAETLEDVFTTHGHQLEGRTLTDDELRDLTTFLRSL